MNATATTTAANGAEPPNPARMDTTPLRFTTPPPDTGEIQKFLGSAASLWAKQRDKLDELEATFAAERFRKVETYQRRMQALGNEAADALRDFDRRHAAAIAEGRRMLAALDALRDS